MREMVKLQSMEGDIIKVEKDIACKSLQVKDIVDVSGVEDEIPLPEIKKATLLKIIEYCTYINSHPPPEIEKPLRTNQISDAVSPWFAEFINVKQEELFELILAANFMEI